MPPAGGITPPPPPAAGFGEEPAEKPPTWEDPVEDDAAAQKTLQLPPDFTPRGEASPLFNIKEEWIYEPYDGDARAFKQAQARWGLLKGQGVISNAADRKVVREVILFRLSQFTLKEARDFKDPGTKGLKPVHVLRTDLLKELINADAFVMMNGSRQFHDAMLSEIVEHAPRLFKYHFVARLNAVILLAELNQTEANTAKGTPAFPYIPAYKPLLEILQPDKPGAKPEERQPDALRVWAVKGLVRIAEIPPALGALGNDIRFPIVEALVTAFESSSKSHPWYQMRLAEGLGKIEAFRDRQNRAIIAQALLKAVVDPKRPISVRAEAAHALGRGNIDEKVNVRLIAWEIARLAAEVSQNATKQPPPPESKMLALRLYMAFQPVNAQERIRLYGLLSKKNLASENLIAVQNSYKHVRPIISAILNDRYNELPALNEKLKTWIENNPPVNARISPEMEPIAGQNHRRTPASGTADG